MWFQAIAQPNFDDHYRSIKTCNSRVVCSLINIVRIFRITSYTIIEHACLFLLTCHEFRCFCHDRERLGGRPPSRSSPRSQPNAQFWWIHDILWPLNWSIKRRGGKDLPWITQTILREPSSTPLFTHGLNESITLRILLFALKVLQHCFKVTTPKRIYPFTAVKGLIGCTKCGFVKLRGLHASSVYCSIKNCEMTCNY